MAGAFSCKSPTSSRALSGLRDYQNMLWISYFKERINTTAKLRGEAIPSRVRAPRSREKL